MGLGRRSAPTAPPIPSRPLPPSAYGIAVPGVSAAADVHFTPPPPPPPRTETPPPYEPPPPAIQYQSPASPSEASAARFGGYAGPADAFAAPPATQFGTPAPSQFGAPPVAYGTPTWSTQPTKKQGSRLWAKVLAGAFAGLMALGFIVRVYDRATVHHVASSMPVAIQDATQNTSAQAQAALASAFARVQTSGDLAKIRHFQAAIYQSPSGPVVADMGDIPANSGLFRDRLVNSFVGEDGAVLRSVTPGKQGGTESCASAATHVVCLWVDNGTVGALFLNSPDVATAQTYLQAFRDQVER